MLDINKVQKLLSIYFEDTKEIVKDAISSNIPLQVISSSLNWYLNLTSDFNPSNLIQAQRDYFGAHQVQLIGSQDFLHFEWD
jgi:6-phosphogluconate dehydrogenase